MRLLAESEQNEGEKGKSVRFSAQRPSPERALCVCCVVANSLSFYLCRRTENHTKRTKRREKERDSNARVTQQSTNFDFS